VVAEGIIGGDGEISCRTNLDGRGVVSKGTGCRKKGKEKKVPEKTAKAGGGK